MPPTEIANSLRQSTAEVLETMCFLGIADPAEAEVKDYPDWLTATVRFQGGRRGTFGVSTPVDLARVMAENLLGEEVEAGDRQRPAECLGEIANMICGGFVHGLESDSVYELTHPDTEFARLDPKPAAIVEQLQLDDGPVCVWAEME